ncbi:MAG: F0F1 ATP synthase subunit B [Lachnospiraceae bacterium]
MTRLFDIDLQLLMDTLQLALSVFVLFLILSYLLFDPVRKVLKDREDKIQGDLKSAEEDKNLAGELKSEYEGKLHEIQKEAEEILSDARQKAIRNESKIIDEAKEEASRILKRAEDEAKMEKSRAMDEMKLEMIQIASMIAEKVVGTSITTQIQESLVDETLKEIGDSTWQS